MDTTGLANHWDHNMVAPCSQKEGESEWATVAYHNGRCKDKKRNYVDLLMEDESIKSRDSKVSEQDSAPSYSEIASGKKTSSVKKSIFDGIDKINNRIERDRTPIKLQKSDDMSTSSSSSTISSKSDIKTTETDKKKRKSTHIFNIERAYAALNKSGTRRKSNNKHLHQEQAAYNSPSQQIDLQVIYKEAVDAEKSLNIINNNISSAQKNNWDIEGDECHDSILTQARSTTPLNNKTDYNRYVREHLPRLFDMVYPVSAITLTKCEQDLTRIEGKDWKQAGMERMIELSDIQHSMLGNQLNKNGLMPAFKHLWQELDDYYDFWNIPYKARKKLLINSIVTGLRKCGCNTHIFVFFIRRKNKC